MACSLTWDSRHPCTPPFCLTGPTGFCLLLSFPSSFPAQAVAGTRRAGSLFIQGPFVLFPCGLTSSLCFWAPDGLWRAWRRGLVLRPHFSVFVTRLSLAVAVVGLDIQDEMGRHEVGHIDNSMKIPLNNGAGCRFEGQFSINKVQRPRSPSPLSPPPQTLMASLCTHLLLPTNPRQAEVNTQVSGVPAEGLGGGSGLPGAWSPCWQDQAAWGGRPQRWKPRALHSSPSSNPSWPSQVPPSPSAHLSLSFHIFRGRME